MSSERPRTPPRSEFGHVSVSTASTSASSTSAAVGTGALEETKSSADYAPRLYDLIVPLRGVAELTARHIPSTFLGAEAVDSSVLLGTGASFSASLQRIPEGPKRIHVYSRHEWVRSTSRPAPDRPDYVVYKVARVSFADDGQALPEYRRAFENFLTEMHALLYPPLFQHKNIIDILGLAWGSNPFSSSHKLPAIIVEYAQHGTLADLLRKAKLGYQTKHILCLDVARGISVVHQAGLVHGDVKAENVLIFSGEDRKYVGKIADFGYSIVESMESTEKWMGGTQPWKAPETQRALPVTALRSTDIYSLGLLIWLVSIDGRNPFDLVVESQMQGTSRADEMERLKQNDLLLAIARKKDWLRASLIKMHAPQLEETVQTLKRTSSDPSFDSRFNSMNEGFPGWRSYIFNRFFVQTCQEKLIRSLDDLFDHSLQMDPEMRDLDVIVSLLESDETPRVQSKTETTAGYGEPQSAIDTTEEDTAIVSADTSAQVSGEKSSITPVLSWSARGYKRQQTSWRKTQDLEPSVQNLIFDWFSGANSSELFHLSRLYMNGYGCEANTVEALRCFQEAANLHHHSCRAYMHRVFAACRKGDSDENPGTKFLETYARIGLRFALEDLEKAGYKEKAIRARELMANTSGGVGAVWYVKDEMLHGFTHSHWIEDDWTLEQIKKVDSELNPVVNKRGDTVLHFVASCGRWKPFQSLIVDYGLDVNLRNSFGETPLLCACRSGQGAIVILCLQRYKAKASIAAHNGETPLHWLSSFSDQWIEAVTQDLITNGARLDAMTHEKVSHSRLDGVQGETKHPWTPLTWAVHNNRPKIVETLLKHGADPNGSPIEQERRSGPIPVAAYFHRYQCLRIMIEHLEGKVTAKSSKGEPELRYALMYGPVVDSAIVDANKFSMILRNGEDYLTALHSTLDLLRERTRFIDFESQFAGSMLYYMVSKAHDEILEYMFDKDWCVDTLNDPCGIHLRTPLLEAIRWNRRSMYQTLLNHGADVHALAANPFQPNLLNWSALHIFAHEGHNKEVSLVGDLVAAGLPADGSSDAPAAISQKPISSSDEALSSEIATLTLNNVSSPVLPCETPFAVAVRRNAFRLASKLLSLGANPSALTLTSGLFISPYPATVLGHVIISNARYSSARLRYLLDRSDPVTGFIVEPARQLSALHRAAMAHRDLERVDNGGPVRREEFDFDTNADILHELLLRWKGKEELDRKCAVHGNTALHLAIEAGNLEAVDSLVRAGASASVGDEDGETALRLAVRLAGMSEEHEAISRRLG